MRQFEKYMEHFSDLPGWFDSPAIAIWDVLLTCQTQRGLTGNLLEIGVWKGKSAALMALHCEADETCILVDIEPMDGARARIGQIVPEAQCVYLQKSSPFLLQQSSLLAMAGNFRWLHLDGEHSSEIVTNDLQIADVLLGRLGMVVVDDFFSPAYPQVTQAVFQFLFAYPSRFSLVLCGFNKAYLCRPIAAHTYLEFIKNDLHTEMKVRGFDRVTIWKTTVPSDMNAFGITDQYLHFEYRGPDWDEDNIPV